MSSTINTKNGINEDTSLTVALESEVESEPKTESEIGRENLYSFLSLDRTNTNDLSFLDKRLDNAEIIFVGEDHGIKCNTDIEMKLLKYLVQNYGITYYLCELPHSVDIKMNEYLESGNPDILDEFYKSSVGTATYTKERKSDLDSIKQILSDMEKNSSIYEEYLGSDALFDIQLILGNIPIGYLVHEKSSTQEKYTIRDQAMYDNFVKLNAHNKLGKYFGQFGISHTFQSELNGVNWFASLLHDNGYQDKMVSIIIEYKNCYRNVRVQPLPKRLLI